MVALDSIFAWARTQPETLAVRSIADFYREVRFAVGTSGVGRSSPLDTGEQIATYATLGAVAQNAPDLVTSDYRDARIAVRLRDHGSRRILGFARRLHIFATERLAEFPELEVDIGGKGSPVHSVWNH